MDLSNNYRQLIQPYFPDAKIVADRFHVIRLIHHHCLQTCQALDPNRKNQGSLLVALWTNPDNLTEKKLKRCDDYLKQQPAMEAI